MQYTTIRRALVAGVVLASMPVLASAAVVVAPNALSDTLGNGQDNETLFLGRRGDTDGQRFQQVYDAGQFSSFGALEAINAIAFRAKTNGGLFPGVFGPTATVSNIIIRLSTTQKQSSIDGPNNISNVFAENVGLDAQTVYAGSLTVTTPTAGTTDFGYVVNFQTPFVYSKALGNLLLDVTIPVGATTTESGFSGYSRFDQQTGDALGANANDGVAYAFGSTGDATLGRNSTTGLVTQFTSVTVPEPTTLAA
jgi:hypothetical protein